MQRREFLRKSCTACAGLAVTGLFLPVLSGCAALSVYNGSVENGSITVPAALFLPEEKMKIIRSNETEFDILLVKNSAAEYHALLMKCTHFSNHLAVTGSGLRCNFHGSEFDLDGRVIHGPASTALQSFQVTEANSNIIIHLS